MTAQIPDMIIWKEEKYEILGYEGGEKGIELFNPKKFGLSPQFIHTACGRGFYCTYKIVSDVLYLDTLCVKDEHGNYPTINGIDASPGEDFAYEYRHINLPIQYSGLIRIGTDFLREYYVHMGFQKPSAYGIVWDIEFSEGKIIDTKDISEKVKEIRGEYHDGYHKRALIDGIYDAFKRDMVLR